MYDQLFDIRVHCSEDGRYLVAHSEYSENGVAVVTTEQMEVEKAIVWRNPFSPEPQDPAEA